nr:tyrosine-type recombinase/integrase [Sphingomonas sp. LHG3406-1]
MLNELGRPFSRKGFGNKFRQWCDEAGLPHCSAHGLRKATLRRMAELRMPNKSRKSFSGHSKGDDIARYTEAAKQAQLAGKLSSDCPNGRRRLRRAGTIRWPGLPLEPSEH